MEAVAAFMQQKKWNEMKSLQDPIFFLLFTTFGKVAKKNFQWFLSMEINSLSPIAHDAMVVAFEW